MNYIFDIDGTLMDIDHRRHFVEGETKDWKSFISHTVYDIPNTPVANVMSFLNTDYNNIFFLTGRKESQRDITIKQIEDCGYNYLNQGALSPRDDYLDSIKVGTKYDPNERRYHYSEILLMRPDDDYRPDAELKSDLFDKLVEMHRGYFATQDTIIFDDRQSVVDMWRSRGLTCFQVAEGDF